MDELTHFDGIMGEGLFDFGCILLDGAVILPEIFITTNIK